MKYDVIAYCWNDALAGFTREDAQRLTHVNLAFGLLKDGLLDLHLLKYLHLLPKLREWNPEMKIVLSVGGWGADGFSDMAMTEEGRRNFAKSCLDAVENIIWTASTLTGNTPATMRRASALTHGTRRISPLCWQPCGSILEKTALYPSPWAQASGALRIPRWTRSPRSWTTCS